MEKPYSVCLPACFLEEQEEAVLLAWRVELCVCFCFVDTHDTEFSFFFMIEVGQEQ